jgi:hypothetical protein
MPESDEVVARSNALTARRSTRASLASKSADYGDEELNAVLDKISRQGLESLTRDEKRLLEEMSRRLRDE